MEISFEGREAVVYREFCSQTRRAQENAESVVPDTEADMQKIAAVQSGVLLKSKDLSSRGVVITGELWACVLYIREGEPGLGSIRVRRPFTLEYELEGLESDTLAQVSLFLQGTDVRMLNPRKLSVTFDVEGQLCCYRSDSLCVDAALPDSAPGLHARMEERALTLPNAVCEKSVAVNEQFALPDAPVTAAPVSEKAALLISDCQLLGSKMIVKGSAELTVVSLREDDLLPVVQRFSTPFSQIVDVGAESMRFCHVRPEITGVYVELIDAITGGKALDMELHAVLQLVCCEQRQLRFVADAYSNLMPAELLYRTQDFALTAEASGETLSAEERVGLMEECAELIEVFPSVSRVSSEGGRLSAAVTLDFLFRNGEGRLSACRRTVALAKECDGRDRRVLRIGAVTCSVRPDGEYADCSVSVELVCAALEKESAAAVSGVVLDEERAYVQGNLPTLTLVRRGQESLWELARRYHSSEEKIRELNEDADTTPRMLLIPKCL